MTNFEASITDFLEARRQFALTARQTAALQLACGIDLHHALAQTGPVRAAIVGKVRRALRRERLKGLCGRGSYSLERHIALKASLERLRGSTAAKAAAANESGARRRRR